MKSSWPSTWCIINFQKVVAVIITITFNGLTNLRFCDLSYQPPIPTKYLHSAPGTSFFPYLPQNPATTSVAEPWVSETTFITSIMGSTFSGGFSKESHFLLTCQLT